MNQFARPGLAVTELPSFNENDKGKVLTINSESGALGWEEGSGGGGTGGGVLVVNMNAGTLDKTWKEISDAISEKPVIILFAMGYDTTVLYVVGVQQASKPGEKYYVTAFSPIEDYASSIVTLAANTSGDYPAIQS